MKNPTTKTALPAETKVRSTTTGQMASVLNGFAFDTATGEWTEYEVETARGIEVWKTTEFTVANG